MGAHLYDEYLLKTEIGMLQILCCDKGLHKINILPHDNLAIKKDDVDLVLSENGNINSTIDSVTSWLKSYFASSLESIKEIPPICPSVFSQKGDFTIKVWKTLMHQVAFGQTVSYSQLAALSGSINASRAVGSAMRNNCLPLIIPCHRVIKADGEMGHFSCGKTVKEWLLKHENASFKS